MLDLSLMRGVWVDPGGAHRPRPGRLPAGRRGSRDPAPRARRGARLRLRHRHRRAHAGRRLRLPDAAASAGRATTCSVDGGGHRRRAAGARQRDGEPGPVLGPARRRRQLRRGDRLRVPALPGRPGDRRRRRRLARRGRAARCSSCTARSPRQAPPELTCVAAAAPGAAGALAARRRSTASPSSRSSSATPGPLEEGEKRRGADQGASARRSATSCSAGPTSRSRALLDATQPKGRRYYWKSEYLPGIEPELLDEAASSTRRASPRRTRRSILFPIDGALNRLPPDHSPVGNRDAALRPQHHRRRGSSAEDDAANIEWARAAWQDMQPLLDRRHLRQLPDRGRRRRAHPRPPTARNYDRLVEVKTRWDPENLFRMNKNITPEPKARPDVV